MRAKILFKKIAIHDKNIEQGFKVRGSGFRVRGSGFGVQGSGFRVQGSGFGVRGSGFRVRGSGFKVQWFKGLGVQESKVHRSELASVCFLRPIVKKIA